MHRRRVSGNALLFLSADLVALTFTRRTFVVLIDLVREPHDAVARSGVDAATADLAFGVLWTVGAWIALVLALSCLAAVPGVIGSAAGRCASAITPRLLAGLVSAAAGTTLLAAPAGANATGPTGWNAAGAPPAAPAVPTVAARPISPPVLPQTPRPAPRVTPEASPDRDLPIVVVQPGDSLWAVAAARGAPDASPADTAASVRRWYAANRDVVGADPDLIHPGQHLRSPNPPEHP